jgi:hypothetical protein
VDFEAKLRATAIAVWDAGYEIGPSVEFGWQLPLFDSLNRLRLFATPEGAAAADDAYDALWRWGDANATVNEDAFHDGNDAYDAAQEQFLRVVRSDMGVEPLAT